MKTKFLKLIIFSLIVIVICSCKEEKVIKKDSSPESNKKIQSEKYSEEAEESDLEDSFYSIRFDSISMYSPVIKQQITKISSNDTRNYQSLKLFKFNDGSRNTFKVDTDKIALNIPVTDKTFKIENAFDFPNNHLNVILVHLKSNNFQSASGIKPTHVLNSEISIDSLKLDKSKLKTDKNLLVILFYNDKLHPLHIMSISDCIENMNGNYQRPFLCEIDSNYKKFGIDLNKIDDFIRPNEIDGDIITGG